MPADKPRPPAESSIPALAQKATRAAHDEALASGKAVLVGRGDKVVRISPDGSERVVKTKAKPTPTTVGAKWTIRRDAKGSAPLDSK